MCLSKHRCNTYRKFQDYSIQELRSIPLFCICTGVGSASQSSIQSAVPPPPPRNGNTPWETRPRMQAWASPNNSRSGPVDHPHARSECTHPAQPRQGGELGSYQRLWTISICPRRNFWHAAKLAYTCRMALASTAHKITTLHMTKGGRPIWLTPYA